MTHTMTQSQPATRASRVATMVYAVGAYAIGMAALAWMVACLAGLTPFGLSGVRAPNPTAATMMNVGLLFLFGLQHSGMSRRRFKAWWT